ncbi:CGNR zinc finger domain-containing protein [Actinoplanes aureus]|uniref:CGNR zinc finger domain-containing protein n=1 Tax=Actinoplanes aureus TaxID=2792083 RepID=A0A931C6V7_9ACTN|nr:CGNR zinc finger domain-containing protein [Actinoplanes aureus]MBG0561548.1 CGNR zinc finger domain-containing protein [Actinoplanes aureus]
MPVEGPLRVVREFVNTYDVEKDVEALPDAGDLTAWLRYAGLLDESSTAGDTDLLHARTLREGIRELLISGSAAVLDEAAERVRLRPRFTPDGLDFTADGTPADRALGRLLAIIARAMADGSWQRLKVCDNDTCRWAYYDSSRSGAGRWCSMAVCGNRRKAQAYRNRRRGGEADRKSSGA